MPANTNAVVPMPTAAKISPPHTFVESIVTQLLQVRCQAVSARNSHGTKRVYPPRSLTRHGNECKTYRSFRPTMTSRVLGNVQQPSHQWLIDALVAPAPLPEIELTIG